MKPINKLMKRLSLYVFLLLFTLQASSWADDIRDFQIEGMSVGDSALDYFSENEIKNNTKKYYDDMTNFPFVAIEIYQHSLFKNYSGVQFHVKKNDKKYKIYSISGYDFYDNDIKGCYKKQNEIDKELSKIFKETKRKYVSKKKHSADESGKSNVTYIMYRFKSGDFVSIDCIDWSSKMKPRVDNLNISLVTKEFNDWLGKD